MNTYMVLYSKAHQWNTQSPDHHIQLARKFCSGVSEKSNWKSLAGKRDT